MKYQLTQKAYQINRGLINEGYCYSEMACYAENRNKAKYSLFKSYGHEINLLLSDNEVSYLNIPVVRYKEADLFLFEGGNKNIRQINEILNERERLLELEKILIDDSFSHCYIKKGGYYRPHSSGYTDFRHRAGIFTKEEAVKSAKSCRDLTIIPINKDEHNKMINDEIDDLKTRLIIKESKVSKIISCTAILLLISLYIYWILNINC